jgi:hypothetical protein
MPTKRNWIGGIPARIANLPVDERGFPVPKFVRYFDGKPDFRVMDGRHLERCIAKDRCWICGQMMNPNKCFVIGPMCCINRVSAEPPSHYECAEFAAKNCPFLSRPLAKRGDLGDREVHNAGLMIDRNPGCCAIWITKHYKTFRAGGTLFEIGEPLRIEFYAQSRRATRAEIDESIRTGIPFLEEAARTDGEDGIVALQDHIAKFTPLLEQYAA